MSGLNKAMLIGNLGMEPEIKYTQGGQAVLRLRLATTERIPSKDSGERQERTEWHTVIVWGKRAEALGKIIRKGERVYIEGRIQSRSWEDRDGAKRYATEIVAHEVLLLAGRSGAGGGERDRDEPRTPPPGGGGRREEPADDFPADDDIPF